jgi:hypothetical protein
MYCAHLRHDDEPGYRCAAFPDGIPAGITESRVDHRRPFRDDHGIQFSPVDEPPVDLLVILDAIQEAD